MSSGTLLQNRAKLRPNFAIFLAVTACHRGIYGGWNFRGQD
jgi:hypothetical protein